MFAPERDPAKTAWFCAGFLKAVLPYYAPPDSFQLFASHALAGPIALPAKPLRLQNNTPSDSAANDSSRGSISNRADDCFSASTIVGRPKSVTPELDHRHGSIEEQNVKGEGPRNHRIE